MTLFAINGFFLENQWDKAAQGKDCSYPLQSKVPWSQVLSHGLIPHTLYGLQRQPFVLQFLGALSIKARSFAYLTMHCI
jgi:hypothetical protein